jgi:hypothetical protein
MKHLIWSDTVPVPWFWISICLFIYLSAFNKEQLSSYKMFTQCDTKHKCYTKNGGQTKE